MPHQTCRSCISHRVITLEAALFIPKKFRLWSAYCVFITGNRFLTRRAWVRYRLRSLQCILGLAHECSKMQAERAKLYLLLSHKGNSSLEILKLLRNEVYCFLNIELRHIYILPMWSNSHFYVKCLKRFVNWNKKIKIGFFMIWYLSTDSPRTTQFIVDMLHSMFSI